MSEAPTQEGAQSAPADDDRDRRCHRCGTVRRVRCGDRRYRTRRLHHLRDGRGADHHGDEDAGRDGRGESVDRFLRRLLPKGPGTLGRILGRVAVLVFLGHRRRFRGDRGRQDHPVLDGRPAVALGVDLHGVDDGDQLVLGGVLRGVRVLVRRHQGGRDHRVHRARHGVHLRIVAGQVRRTSPI